MSIKTNLEYEERLDAVVGFDDLGDNQRSNKIANYATVFMIRSLFGSWKQPVGYFLTSGPMTADTSKRKLLQCIDEVKKWFDSKVVICDQGPSNICCYNMLGVNVEGYFNSGSSRIYFLYDPPHLLKSIRNGLYNKGFSMNKNEIMWKHIVTL